MKIIIHLLHCFSRDMPSKRSKSKEREKKKRARERMSQSERNVLNENRRNNRQQRSVEKRDTDATVDSKRKREERLNQNEQKRKEEREETQERVEWFRLNRSFEKGREDCDAENERKKERRAKMNYEDRQQEVEEARKRMKELRFRKEEHEIEFANISVKHRERCFRDQRTGKEKLKNNLKAKKGMRLFRGEGRLKKYKERTSNNLDETSDWKNFMQKSKKNAEMVEQFKPDIVSQINEKVRADKERNRRKAEKEKADEIAREIK